MPGFDPPPPLRSHVRGHRKHAVGFFAVVLVIGMLSFRDYGVAVDAGTMDALGRATYDYIFHGADWPTNPAWKHHGTLVELPIYAASNLMASADDLPNIRLRVFTQHFSVFLLSFFGLVMLYLLARKRFGDHRWALLCCLCLLLTPRIFAHSFYNSRDIPTLALFTASMYTLLHALERQTPGSAAIHGIASGLTLSLRMPALIIPVLTALFFALDAWDRWIRERIIHLRRTVLLFSLYLLCLAFTTYLSWPFLWEHPLAHFLQAYDFMSMSAAGTTQTFLGHTYAGAPWHYIPVWFLITVPPLITVFFVIGATLVLFSCSTSPRHFLHTHKTDLLFLSWFFLPILSILVKGSGIYTEWRHVYFVYPAFLLLAVGGVRSAAQWMGRGPKTYGGIIGGVLVMLFGMQILSTGFWMICNHPREFAYFSAPPRWLHPSLSQPSPDYWGLSYRDAMRFLLAHDTGILSLYSEDNIAYQNLYNLFPQSLSRVMRVPRIEDAMYVVTRSPQTAEGLPLLHPVMTDGMLLSGVYEGPVKQVIVDAKTKTVEFRR